MLLWVIVPFFRYRRGGIPIGANSLLENELGLENTAVGANTLYSNTTGSTNVGLEIMLLGQTPG